MLFCCIGKFPIELELRGGAYFVNSLPKLSSGEPNRAEITQLANKWFKSRIDKRDPEITGFLSDIPQVFGIQTSHLYTN